MSDFLIMRLTLECGMFGFSEFNFIFGVKMYNTWDIACKIFPFWAAIMLWLIYLLFRGEKPSKELVVSTRKEFYFKCYELENRENISETAQNILLIGTFCEKISKNAYLVGQELEMKLRAQGKWIERDLSKGRQETDYSKVPKTKKNHDHIANISSRNHMVEGYKVFKESKKEVITKPISLIPETITDYDVELFKKSIQVSFKP